MTVSGYNINTSRPIAPSEAKRDTIGTLRRVVGSGGLGAALGAGVGHYTGRGSGVGAAIGGGVGALHGVLKSQESAASDRTTQERMEMRRAHSDQKKEEARAAKEKRAMDINITMLRSMAEELTEIQKEAEQYKEAFPVAAVGKALSSVGGKLMGGASKGLKGLAGRGGAVGEMAGKAHGGLTKGIKSGVQRFGGRRLKQGVGAAALGAGALGAGALASQGRSRN